MKYDKSKMNPELRKIPLIARALPLPNVFSRTGCKMINKALKLTMAGKCENKEITYHQHWIPRSDGTKLRVCIYGPKGAKIGKVPGLLWLHGGGYGFGIPENDLAFIQEFIKDSDCVVVAPDYRCSVDAPYPAAIKDCYMALLWMKKNADKLGIRSNQIIVGGDSAGGGLTAAVSLYARDRKQVNIAFQMPLYPMIDDRMITESSQNNHAPLWNSDLNYIGWKLYLADKFETDQVSKYAAPSRETDYSNLPPTCTFVGSIEPFRDETIEYIENLKKAGVETYFNVYEGCYHGFDQLFPNSRIGKEATKFLHDTFKYAVEHYFAEQPE